MNRAVARIDDMAGKFRLRPVAGTVFQIQNLSGLAGAKHGDDQIELAVAAEISSLYIRYTTDTGQQRDGLKCAVHFAVQEDDAANRVVGGEEFAQTGHENVAPAVAVQVRHAGMTGSYHLWQRLPS